MGFSCGIIGLPNVGKSTIFNALTQSAVAQAANFPFCTIEPNTGAVAVPDERLAKLGVLNKSEKVIPTQVTFVDIAGLIRGASKGEGLGNQFLGHIRSVEAIAHVVRCFDDKDVVHVDGDVDPIRDIETIETELLLADLDGVQKALPKLEKLVKSGDKDAKIKFDILTALEVHLGEGKAARIFPHDTPLAKELFGPYLTAKPVMFIANVDEADLALVSQGKLPPLAEKVAEYAEKHDAAIVAISGKVEAELVELSEADTKEYLASLGMTQSGLDRMAISGYGLLNLATYFTSGPKETRAWTVTKGTKAPQAAGVIHSDFERGFIRAEVISYEDYIAYGSELKVKEAGKLRVEGKEYTVVDGDVMHFRFNV